MCDSILRKLSYFKILPLVASCFVFICGDLKGAAEEQKRIAIIFGAGGEPPGPVTNFDYMFEKTGSLFSGMGYQTKIFFDGGHPQSSEKLAKVFPNDFQPATVSNFETQIASVKSAVASGNLKQGDQVFIYINSHGSPSSSNELTHKISASNGSVSLDKLKELRDVLEAKNIKLAIADFSCYSGNSQALASEKTCVISETAPGIMTYFSSLGAHFHKNLQPGKDLEAIFLESRAQDKSNSLPEISTPIHREIRQNLSSLFAGIEDLESLAKNENRSTSYSNCSQNSLSPNQIESLRNLSNHVTQNLNSCDKVFFTLDGLANTRSNGWLRFINSRISCSLAADILNLSSSFSKYNEIKNRVSDSVSLLNGPSGATEERIPKLDGSVVRINWRNLALIDHQTRITEIENKLKNKGLTETQRAELYKDLSYYKLTNGQKNFLRFNRNFRQLDDAAKLLRDLEKSNSSIGREFYSARSEISRVERAIYDRLYKDKQRTDTKPNPCRSFVI
jgi:hypothetical protein